MFASDTLAALAIEGWIGAPPEDGMLFARPLRVLVTQDDPDLLDLLTLSLERGGFEVIACRDVATASALLAATEPDAIVTDLQMPDVESFGVFRNEPRNPVIPVVALTTNEQDAAVQALATPGVTVVRKVEAAAVARTLRDAVRAVQVGLGGEGTVPASDGVDEALTIVGRHPAYRHGDVPVTAEALAACGSTFIDSTGRIGSGASFFSLQPASTASARTGNTERIGVITTEKLPIVSAVRRRL